MSLSSRELSTPVLFLIFIRPQLTARVFEEIRRAKPRRLFVVADGPSSAIGWFFENVDEGIILEDDCVPHPTFFPFCQELLAHYRTDTRIMPISGTNLQFARRRGDGSYYFSRFMHCWGWASWRRAWAHFDVELKTLPQFLRQKQLGNIFSGWEMRRHWRLIFEKSARGQITPVWDFQWSYAIFVQNGLCVVPNVNLVTNLSWGPQTTNTFDPKHIAANIPARPLDAIVHPTFVFPDLEADEFEARHFFLLPLHKRAINRAKMALRLLRFGT